MRLSTGPLLSANRYKTSYSVAGIRLLLVLIVKRCNFILVCLFIRIVRLFGLSWVDGSGVAGTVV